ncbi:MAG: PAS domain S-box protein, partial [Gammaproteobacteria bacterium]|nr:PAS domain S-box protein [Gammaproteobacteria bacterium]
MPTPSKDVRSSDREAVVSLDEHLSREQIKFLYEHIPAGLFGTLVACLLITVLSYETIDSTHLFTWFSAVLLVSALRLLLFLRFRKSFQQAHKSWEKIFFVGVLASAALFGVSGVLFFQEHDPIAQSFLTLVLGGISAGAVTSLSFKRYMIVVYIGLVMVPLTVRYFSFSNDKNTVLGFAIITFVLFLLTNANRFYRNSVSRFRLVFETERQARQIKESDRLLHSVIESMPVGLLQLDVDSGNQFVLESSNKAASEILGMDFQGQHGLPITDVFPALRKSDFLTTIRQTKDKGISQTIQNMNYKDENIDSSFDVFVFQTTENQVGIIFADISERKKVIDALEESESRFRDLADKAPALIWMADVNNLGIWFNQTWLNYTGRSLDQELGIGWSEGVHPDDIDKSVLLCQSAFDRREQFEMEFRLRRSDGEYGWIADTGIPRFTDAGEFVGYIGY